MVAITLTLQEIAAIDNYRIAEPQVLLLVSRFDRRERVGSELAELMASYPDKLVARPVQLAQVQSALAERQPFLTTTELAVSASMISYERCWVFVGEERCTHMAEDGHQATTKKAPAKKAVQVTRTRHRPYEFLLNSPRPRRCVRPSGAIAGSTESADAVAAQRQVARAVVTPTADASTNDQPAAQDRSADTTQASVTSDQQSDYARVKRTNDSAPGQNQPATAWRR